MSDQPIYPFGDPLFSSQVRYDAENQGELLAEAYAERFGPIPSGVSVRDLQLGVFGPPHLPSIGMHYTPETLRPLSRTQLAYIAKVRRDVEAEQKKARSKVERARQRKAERATAKVRAQGRVVLEGPAVHWADYEDRGVTIAGAELFDVFGEAYDLGRVRITIEFLEEVTDV